MRWGLERVFANIILKKKQTQLESTSHPPEKVKNFLNKQRDVSFFFWFEVLFDVFRIAGKLVFYYKKGLFNLGFAAPIFFDF